VADFPTCYAFVLSNEDYTPPRYLMKADPTKADPTACSISGINSAAFPIEYLRILMIQAPHRGPAVEAFYQATYWNSWISQLPDALAMRVMDAEVNDGGGIGVRLLQKAVNKVCTPVKPPIAEDGLWGPITVAVAVSCVPPILIAAFKAARVAFYESIGGPDLPAWLVRANK
jgi:hypothetical protein